LVSGTSFTWVDLAVTKRAVLELEIVELTLKSLVLASFASIVVFGQY
jgi:hypothetical protein